MGVGNKTGPLDNLEHPVPLFGGELANKNPMYRRAAPWVGNHADVRPVTENTEDGKERRVWSTLSMEKGVFW